MKKYVQTIFIATVGFISLIAFQNCSKGFSTGPASSESSSLSTPEDSSSPQNDELPTGTDPIAAPVPAPDSTGPTSPDTSPTVEPPQLPTPSEPDESSPPDGTSPSPDLPTPSPSEVTETNAPVFYKDYTLTDTSVYLGDPFKLAAKASGIGIIYSWYKDGAATVADKTGFEYSKNNSEYSDAGIYTIVATNKYGSASVSSTLKILAPVAPIFSNSAYINAYSVYAGDRVKMSGGRAVGGDIKYRWYKDNVLMTNTGIFASIAVTSVSDSGQYRVEAYNSLGVATRTFSLTVMPMEQPKFSEALADQSIYAGDFLAINSKGATGGGIKYRWYKDGVIIPDETLRSYTKNPAAVTDAGTYKLEGYNALGSAFVNCTISVTPR